MSATLDAYRADPCRASSLPVHKWPVLTPAVRVEHASVAEPSPGAVAYFRLRHDLATIPDRPVPAGYALGVLDTDDPAALLDLEGLVERCYPEERFPVARQRERIGSAVFDPGLWLAIRDASGALVGAAISEYDGTVPEGALEWVQVDPRHARRGLASALVCESLRRLAGRALFATVSGRVDNATRPDALYRRCGFTGDDVWWVYAAST